MNLTFWVLVGLLVFQQLIALFERRDLYTRLMASNLRDYQMTKGGPVGSGLDVYGEAKKRHKPIGDME